MSATPITDKAVNDAFACGTHTASVQFIACEMRKLEAESAKLREALALIANGAESAKSIASVVLKKTA